MKIQNMDSRAFFVGHWELLGYEKYNENEKWEFFYDPRIKNTFWKFSAGRKLTDWNEKKKHVATYLYFPPKLLKLDNPDASAYGYLLIDCHLLYRVEPISAFELWLYLCDDIDDNESASIFRMKIRRLP